MTDFFKDWRRKLGVVTLVMGLVLMCGWERSLTIQDSINFPCGKNTLLSLDSANQSVIWSRFDEMDTVGVAWPTWNSGSADELDYSPTHDFVDCYHQFMGFGVGRVSSERTLGPVIVFWVFPDWSIVIPLTLLSACLLLSKPRKSP